MKSASKILTPRAQTDFPRRELRREKFFSTALPAPIASISAVPPLIARRVDNFFFRALVTPLTWVLAGVESSTRVIHESFMNDARGSIGDADWFGNLLGMAFKDRRWCRPFLALALVFPVS